MVLETAEGQEVLIILIDLDEVISVADGSK
jgi:hypothetical protein